MQSRNLLTILLYALIGMLLFVVVYKGCMINKDKQARVLEEKKFDQELRNMGYIPGDSLSGSSSFTEGANDAKTAAQYKDGAIEGATTTVSTAADAVASTTKNAASKVSKGASSVVAKGIEGIEGADVKAQDLRPVTSGFETDEEGKKVRVADLDEESNDVGKPKYMVIAGSFTKLMNARQGMEDLVKKGYHDAEVGKFNRGKYACSIAKRTDNLEVAKGVVAKLKAKGYKDAFVKSKK